MARQALLLCLLCASYAHASHYATYKIHTNNVERHASGLHLPNPLKKQKLVNPHAPKPRKRANPRVSAYDRLLIEEMRLAQ